MIPKKLWQLLLLIGFISCTNKPSAESIQHFPNIIDPDSKKGFIAQTDNWNEWQMHPPYYFGIEKAQIHLKKNYWSQLVAPAKKSHNEQVSREKKPKKHKYYRLELAPTHTYRHSHQAEVRIAIDTNQVINEQGKKSMPVLLQNQTTDTLLMGTGNHIFFAVEALLANGEWHNIQTMYRPNCPVNSPSIILPPKEFVLCSTPITNGDFRTKLRIRLGKNLSQEFIGMISSEANTPTQKP